MHQIKDVSLPLLEDLVPAVGEWNLRGGSQLPDEKIPLSAGNQVLFQSQKLPFLKI